MNGTVQAAVQDADARDRAELYRKLEDWRQKKQNQKANTSTSSRSSSAVRAANTSTDSRSSSTVRPRRPVSRTCARGNTTESKENRQPSNSRAPTDQKPIQVPLGARPRASSRGAPPCLATPAYTSGCTATVAPPRSSDQGQLHWSQLLPPGDSPVKAPRPLFPTFSACAVVAAPGIARPLIPTVAACAVTATPVLTRPPLATVSACAVEAEPTHPPARTDANSEGRRKRRYSIEDMYRFERSKVEALVHEGCAEMAMTERSDEEDSDDTSPKAISAAAPSLEVMD